MMPMTRIETIPVSEIVAHTYLDLIDRAGKIAPEEYARACRSCGYKPTWTEVAFDTGITEEPVTDRGLAARAQNMVEELIHHIWPWHLVQGNDLDKDLVYKTIGGVRYLVGIDNAAIRLQMMKAVGLLREVESTSNTQ